MKETLFAKACEYFYENFSNPRKILEIKEKISSVNLIYKYNIFYKYIYGPNERQFNQALKQYLISRYYSIKINKAIIISAYSNKSNNILLIPNEWILFLKKNNVNVSTLSHFLFVISLYKVILKSLYCYFLAVSYKSHPAKSKYVYFIGLNSSCLPVSGQGAANFNVVNWYIVNDGGSNEIRHAVTANINEYYFYNRKIVYQKYPFQRIFWKNFFRFSIWFLLSLILVFFSISIGRWKFAILFSEAVKNKWFDYSKSTADHYIFNLSDYVYRPLWTYNKKSKITMLSYSSSFHQFKTELGDAPLELGYNIVSWPEIKVFTKDYCLLLKSKIFSPVVDVRCVEPIWFTDTSKDIKLLMPKNKNKNLALFDIAPVNKLYGYALGSYPVYRTYENGRVFLNDIYEIANDLQVNILFKAKRNFGEIHDERYINFFDEFCKRKLVYKIPYDASPVNLAQYADMSISIPFTSTAFMMGDIPSVFYDPTSNLLRNDPGAQGKRLISSKKELREWFIYSCNYNKKS